MLISFWSRNYWYASLPCNHCGCTVALSLSLSLTLYYLEFHPYLLVLLTRCLSPSHWPLPTILRLLMHGGSPPQHCMMLQKFQQEWFTITQGQSEICHLLLFLYSSRSRLRQACILNACLLLPLITCALLLSLPVCRLVTAALEASTTRAPCCNTATSLGHGVDGLRQALHIARVDSRQADAAIARHIDGMLSRQSINLQTRTPSLMKHTLLNPAPQAPVGTPGAADLLGREACEGKHADLIGNMLPRLAAQALQLATQRAAHIDDALGHLGYLLVPLLLQLGV